MSNLCYTEASGAKTCAYCGGTAEGSPTCDNGIFAANDLAKTGTCNSNGSCSYKQACTENSSCSSNLCANKFCEPCDDAATCATGTQSASDYEMTCTNNVCSYEETGLSGGAIAGIVIGSVVFVLLVVVGVWFCTRSSGETESSKAVAYETLHAE